MEEEGELFNNRGMWCALARRSIVKTSIEDRVRAGSDVTHKGSRVTPIPAQTSAWQLKESPHGSQRQFMRSSSCHCMPFSFQPRPIPQKTKQTSLAHSEELLTGNLCLKHPCFLVYLCLQEACGNVDRDTASGPGP